MKGFEGKICRYGVWDESIPSIEFDDSGISSYAKIFQKMLNDFPLGKEGNRSWLDFVRLMKFKGRGKNYDCIVGVSGGTDSSYLLHLASLHGLRVLAVYLDNGWGSNIAVTNIKKMIQALKFDLETYVINYNEVIDVFKSYLLAGLPWVDGPTDIAIKAVLYKTAKREGIRFILIGHDFRSEGFQPNEWTYTDSKQLKHVTYKFSKRRLKTFPYLTIWDFGYLAFFRKIKLIRPFFYLKYSKKEAKEFLSKEYGWEDYGGHHYENLFTKFIISYWLPKKFGIDKRKITYSAQILSGEISREFAIEEIGKETISKENIEKDLIYVSKKLQISKNILEGLINTKGNSFNDYPSYFPMINKLKKIIFPIMKYFLPNKPLMFYQMEKDEK